MNRGQFLKTAFLSAVALAIADARIPKLLATAEPIVPGVGGTPFKIKLMKGWFRNGDIVIMDSLKSKWIFIEKDGELKMQEVTNDPEPKEMIVEYISNAREATDQLTMHSLLAGAHFDKNLIREEYENNIKSVYESSEGW